MMKKSLLTIVNIIIMAVVMIVVVVYTNHTSTSLKTKQVQDFEDSTEGLVQSTINYLYGAQQVANTWGHYINSQFLTMEEAIQFLRDSKADDEDLSAQLLFVDQKLENVGLSVEPDVQHPDNYTVRYRKDMLFQNFEDASYEHEDHRKIYMTRMFTNLINGKQSVAFYHPITLKDAETGLPRSAVVMFVVAVSSLDYNLKNGSTQFANAANVIMTRQGDYISRHGEFKNTNFFEFLNSYNHYDSSEFAALKQQVLSGKGSFHAINSRKEVVHIAYASAPGENSFFIVSMLPDRDLQGSRNTNIVILTIGAGLLLLFLFNMTATILANNHLVEAMQQADKANQAKTDFLSAMSHDIRTPLNAILGFTSIALKHAEDKEKVTHHLTQIAQAGDHLLMLVNDILDISQIEHQGIRLNPQVVSLDKILSTLRSIAEPIAQEKNMELVMEMKNVKHHYLMADPLRLHQIYVNLLSNALKYTNPYGQVRLTLEECETASPEVMCLHAVIADTGIGMDKDFIPHMFEPFIRQDKGKVNKIIGTGLGLSITKHLVDLMQGTIVCQSEAGRGTIFTVDINLPIAEQAESTVDIATALSSTPMHLLVAEDNDLNWEITQLLLDVNGMTADRAKDGQMAVDMLRADPDKYAAVLMDVRMPILDGLEATRIIRKEKNPKLANMPILALTAEAFAESIRECELAGMNGHIAKPIQMEELLQKIAQLKGVGTK